LRIFPTKNTRGEKKYCAEKIVYSYVFVDFAKEKGNREAVRKFNVGETSVREWRKEEAVIKCLHQKKRAMRYKKTLVEWVLSMRLKGSKVSTTSILLK
jgi:hypothetical protein